MKSKRGASALAAVLTLVIAGCNEESDDASPATSDGPTKASATTKQLGDRSPAPVDAASRVAFSSEGGSRIGFLGSTRVGRPHNCGFSAYQGSLNLDQDKKQVAKLAAEIETGSVSSDDPKLTELLKSADFLDVAAYPKSSFVSTSIAPGSTPGSYTITGNLTLHGVTKSIIFPASISVDDKRISLKSEFSIKKSEFGMTFTGEGAAINDDVTIDFEISAERPADAAATK